MEFLKKKEEGGAPGIPGPGQGTPTEAVLTMAQQGMSPNQVVEALQRQGYTQTQIYDALNQAASKAHVEQGIPTPAPEMPPAQAPAVMDAPTQEYAPAADAEQFEEIAESIIEEKWQEVRKTIGAMKEAQDDSNKRFLTMQQEITDLKDEMNNLHKAIVTKVSDYDKNLINVGVEIKAMEKVFQKILPTLTDNVNELSKITKDMKQ